MRIETPTADELRERINAIRASRGLPPTTYETEEERHKRRGIPAPAPLDRPLGDTDLPDVMIDFLEFKLGCVYVRDVIDLPGWRKQIEQQYGRGWRRCIRLTLRAIKKAIREQKTLDGQNRPRTTSKAFSNPED